MDLYKEILVGILQNSEIKVTFPEIDINSLDIIEMKSYSTLVKIKEIINDDSLDDHGCFMKIEEIICLFEELGSGAGTRHDF